MSLTKTESLKLYEGMARARNFEQQAYDNFGSGLVYGFVHVGVGEEAIASGVCANLEEKDYVSTYHRGHGHMLLKGLESKKMFAEICGKVTAAVGALNQWITDVLNSMGETSKIILGCIVAGRCDPLGGESAGDILCAEHVEIYASRQGAGAFGGRAEGCAGNGGYHSYADP